MKRQILKNLLSPMSRQNDNNEVVKVGTFQVPNIKQMAEAIVMQAIENGLEVKELKALNTEIANQIKALA